MTPARRIAFALPGFHRVNRGAEVALESVARELARLPGFEVTLFGAGHARAGEPYRFVHAARIARERFVRFPRLPVLRHEYAYEELTFFLPLLARFRPRDFDATVGCSYPFTNWALRLRRRDRRPRHIYVTQNGDWPCRRRNAEYKYFSCDGLVCTNPDYFDANKDDWPCSLIPNGVDPARFSPGAPDRASFHLPEGVPLAIMVSALIDSKRVLDGIRAVARAPGVFLAVAGDGPLRDAVRALGEDLLPGRFRHLTLARERMPEFYRAADCFLHMSLDEPSANAYIEALASGLPVVTHDRRVTRWTFDDTAHLVDANDLDAVARAIERACDDRSEERVRERLDLVARRYTWSAIARDYARFIDQTIARGGAA